MLLSSACLWLALAPGLPAATPLPVIFSDGQSFAEREGDVIYRSVCQACHMPDGRGDRGAGIYPSLIANPKLGAKGYVAYMVVNGAKAMPAFGGMMDDEQVAAVVNYLRLRFNNGRGEDITPAEVRALRQQL